MASPAGGDAGRTRWAPDHQLIPAVLAGGGRKMAQLTYSDRCWLVAGLTLSGLTAEDIADRLSCSLRLVRSIRAEDMTAVCVQMQTETRNFTDELRLVRTELTYTKATLDQSQDELERVRGQLNRMIDAHMVGTKLCGRCSTPMAGYNVYECAGKQYCRECHRRNAKAHRERRKYSSLPFAVALDFA